MKKTTCGTIIKSLRTAEPDVADGRIKITSLYRVCLGLGLTSVKCLSDHGSGGDLVLAQDCDWVIERRNNTSLSRCRPTRNTESHGVKISVDKWSIKDTIL